MSEIEAKEKLKEFLLALHSKQNPSEFESSIEDFTKPFKYSQDIWERIINNAIWGQVTVYRNRVDYVYLGNGHNRQKRIDRLSSECDIITINISYVGY
ncbi:MAG: hypothetical protein GTO16_08245, partial [Candidatus Aminicenantes bacterium]|nr:hypothetical protein [Candidatus Aminicenantes bacterium]